MKAIKSDSCKLRTMRDKLWCNEQNYTGEIDRERRRNGTGENRWRGSESIEWYNGHFTRDTMNGPGEYRWRYRGPDSAFVTYEGRFYGNRMHGYGTMSYPDGRTFTGLYHENYRWGPGIESHVSLQEDVGFWRGSQLIRLAWRPAGLCIALKLMEGYNGKAMVEPFRVMLTETSKTIGETNSAIELLKSYGAEPLRAADNWQKLYLKHSTDLESQACHVEGYEYEFYKGKIHSLEVVSGETCILGQSEDQNDNEQSDNSIKVNAYFAWNNNQTMVHMMKHCYKHDEQRNSERINITKFLSGPRKHFRPAGKHERECRTLLMASYLGRILNVAQLINENNVHPNLADMQGNTALMYATCADNADIIHFLVEAGADVNSYNDSCCTPLGVALTRLMCLLKDIAPNMMVQALLPPLQVLPAPPAPISEFNVIDWNINREVPDQESNKAACRSFSKGEKKSKSILALDSPASSRKKSQLKETTEREYDSEISFSEERILYSTITEEYLTKVNSLFVGPNLVVPYIFEVPDMVIEVEANELLLKPVFVIDKKISKPSSKVIRSSKQVMWTTNTEVSEISENSSERIKLEMLSKMMLTILQLLSDGANPRLVRCPQPALFIAVTAGCTDLVRHLVHYGVNINETYPETHGYTALDVAIALPFTPKNLEVIKALLENGADANHRLRYHSDIPGPSLLHAVLVRKIESHNEDEVLHSIIDLLLEHNCNSGTQFNGRSAVDVAMTKSLDLLDIFIKNPKTNLNEVINSLNQTALVKMFSLSYFKLISGTNRFPTLTNLLLYGADPLIECHDGEKSYRNIFELARHTLDCTEAGKALPISATTKVPKNGKVDSRKTTSKTDAKRKTVSEPSKFKPKTDDIGDYKVALDLVTECARILRIRWIQAKILKELISVINRYKHRQWNIILKEYNDRKCIGLWLTTQRCLEIWDILNTTKKKLYKNNLVLKHLLCIVQFCNNKSKLSLISEINPTMTAVEKRNIESDVRHLLIDHEIVLKLNEHAKAWKGLCVKPELDVGVNDKYKICFECALPLTEAMNILCTLCRLVSFCSFECMKVNVERPFCHPCCDYLKERYSKEMMASEAEINEI